MLRIRLPAIVLLIAGCSEKPQSAAVPAGPSYSDLCKLVEVKEQELRDIENKQRQLEEVISARKQILIQQATTTRSVQQYETLQAAIAYESPEEREALEKSRKLVEWADAALADAKKRRDKAAP